LSPAGEYNLRLGVMKELHPDLIATYQGEEGGKGVNLQGLLVVTLLGRAVRP
jgi:hypothetical protein